MSDVFPDAPVAGSVAGRIAELLGTGVFACTQLGRRTARIDPKQGQGPVILRHAEPDDSEGCDGIGREFGAIGLMHEMGHGALVPVPIAADVTCGVALYRWVGGAAVVPDDPATRQPEDLGAAMHFLALLHDSRLGVAARAQPACRDACIRLTDLVALLRERATVLGLRPELRPFFDVFDPALGQFVGKAREIYAFEGWREDRPLTDRQCTLAVPGPPFAGAIRQAVGHLVFTRFPDFGWDDPVRVAAELLLHPAGALTAAERRAVGEGIASIYGEDAGFPRRLLALFPLHGLRLALACVQASEPADSQDRLARAFTLLGHVLDIAEGDAPLP